MAGVSRLYAGSTDKIVRIWNVATPSPIHSVAVVNEGAKLVTGHENGRLRAWSVASFTEAKPRGVSP